MDGATGESDCFIYSFGGIFSFFFCSAILLWVHVHFIARFPGGSPQQVVKASRTRHTRACCLLVFFFCRFSLFIHAFVL